MGGIISNFVIPEQIGRHFADIFKCLFMNKHFYISIWISLYFFPYDPFDKKSALVQVMD